MTFLKSARWSTARASQASPASGYTDQAENITQ
jgi:hypothetical protein